MGALASQDEYDVPLEQSTGVGWANRLGEILNVHPEYDETVQYRTASPLVNITEGDIGRATAAAMGVAGGGLKTEVPPGSILSGMKVTSDRPWYTSSKEAFEQPVVAAPLPQAQGAIRPNTFADPRLRAKAEKIWNTYPQYAEQYPDVGPPALRAKMPDPKNEGKFLSKATKEEVPYATLEEALAKDAEPGYFLEKKLLPEVEKFQKDRNIVQRDMELHGYTPYFDPAKRADVTGYGPFADTRTAANPKTAATTAKFDEMYGTPAARARLQAGYEKGASMPDTDRWYFMKQLENEYIKELGHERGRDAFAKEFAGMMAATTGGASPYDNFLMSHYANYVNKAKERLPERAYQMPFPIGGRFASGNMEQAQKYIDLGQYGFSPVKNPKRHDFQNAYLGDVNAGVMDEQMFGAIMPGQTIPQWYGPATRVLHEEAGKIGHNSGGVRGMQDVAWAGLKALKTEAETGKPFRYEGPMINQINKSIETTHRLTGMPREEIVKRGLIYKQIPMYGLGGAAVMGSLAAQDDYR
jgi:hypothetical protein